MGKPNELLRVAAYVRVSTEEQKVNGLSIDAQRAALENWAKSNGVNIYDFYNDAGISARKKYNKRPELLRLLSDAEEGKIDLIIFTKLDRWFRNIAEYYKVQEILESHNVNWKAIHEDYDTMTSSGRLKINIMLSVAQDEADRDSERIKAVFENKRANGEPVTGCLPTGYIVRDKKMIKDEEWVPALDTFFSSYLQYQSIRKAREDVKENNGKNISYELADALLRKTVYYGFFNRVEGMCPPYISKDQYNLIQRFRKRTERHTKENRVYLFTGIIYCPVCGNRFQSCMSKYKKKDGTISEHPVYNCHSTYVRGNCTNRVNMREKYIEEYLLNNIESFLDGLYAEVKEEPKENIFDYSKEKASIKRKLSKLKDLYVNELIDIEVYRSDYEKYSAQLLDIESKQTPAPKDISKLKSAFKEGWRGMYESASRKNKQAFWRNTLEKIIINPDRTINLVFLQ